MVNTISINASSKHANGKPYNKAANLINNAKHIWAHPKLFPNIKVSYNTETGAYSIEYVKEKRIYSYLIRS